MTTPDEDESKTGEGPSKRIKTDILPKDVISPGIMERENEDRLVAEYAAAKPYSHGLIENVFLPDFLRSVQTEIKDNSKVTFKESDLFRVFQSIDLGNLDESDAQTIADMPTVLQLRRVLYSDQWRSFIERLCQLPVGTLSAQVDCACNCHTAGCHLLTHDDVIGTRKISYILYLTESDWTAAEGGALELYDSHVAVQSSSTSDDPEQEHDAPEERIPQSVPSSTLLPIFNNMAFFAVEPGKSFHAVQEVFGDRPRLSLQGWYHAAEAPDNMEAATLQRLKTAGGSQNTERDFEPFTFSDETKAADTEEKSAAEEQEPPATTLSVEDQTYLAQYLHPTYLQATSIQEIRDRFEEESSVQLRNLLNDEWAAKMREAMVQPDSEEQSLRAGDFDPAYYQQGTSDEWKLVGPAHKQRFLEYSSGSKHESNASAEPSQYESAGEILQHVQQYVLESPSFARFLRLVTSLGLPTARRGRARRFRRGLDYTVAHYGLLTEESVLDATLCFVAGTGQDVNVAPDVEEDNEQQNGDDQAEPPEPNEDDIIWQSGDCGGFECYIAADDDEEAADEYNQDDDTELLSVSASFNTLSLVYRDPGTMRFVKYVGSKAPSSRWDIAMEYQMEEGGGDDDEDEDDEEDEEGGEVEEELGTAEGDADDS
jgi:Rps23 Pro-64 3,4-dihydroxylase Tpa1-like proline 4-hydroxylase